MICDSAAIIIDRNGDDGSSASNGAGANHQNDNGIDTTDDALAIDSTLDAVKCILEKSSNGIRHQIHDVVIAQIPTTAPPPPPITIAAATTATTTIASNGCMSSWYSRCKWRSQSCDRKQKYCPRPRYSWINGYGNSHNGNHINNNHHHNNNINAT